MVPSSDIRPVEDGIWQFSTTNMEVIDDHAENHRFVVPIWQVTPISLERRKVLFNSYSEPARRRALDLMMEYRQPTATKVLSHGFEKRISEQYLPVPRTVNFYPIFNSFSGLAEDTNVAAAIALEWRWDLTFQNVLQFEKNVFVVVENNCGQSFSFDIKGADAIYLGEGDHHDASFDRYKMITTNKETLEHFEASQLSFPPPAGFEDYISVQKIVGDGDAPGCSYTLIIYPTQRYLDTYATKRPAIFTFAVIMIFIFAIVVFAVYDRLVERRQSLVMDTAVKSSQIVNEFYPPEFVNRVIHPKEEETAREIPDRSNSSFRQRRLSLAFKSPVHSLQTFLTERVVNSENPVSKPIAEMFSECTILFADIAGFTAWASERDPIQVFELLEALYREFDSLAHRLGVFKVETIGDCYVAVVGLPVQNSAHAKIMSRFASKIHRVMRRLTQQLEVQLGPGTSDLKLRIGLHSGPVIAGVLRGEKPRFQLFGDSVNMVS
jgi:class 3 adenylate cyclase